MSFKRLLAPMLGTCQRIIAGNIKFIKANFVQEHINAAQVVGGDIHLLAIKTIAHRILAQNLRRLQQQGAGAAGRVSKVSVFDTIER